LLTPKELLTIEAPLIVSKAHIYPINAQYGTHYPSIKHTLGQYPNQIEGITNDLPQDS